MRRQDRLAMSPRRILVLKPCCLGDLVQTTSVIAALQEHWPAAEITVGTGRWSAPAVDHHPSVAAVIDVGTIGLRGKQRPAELLRLWSLVRRRRFDMAVVPDRSPVPAILLWLCGIPVRAGYDSGGRGRWYTVRVTPRPQLHELDQAQRLLQPLGVAFLPLPRVYPGPEGTAEGRAVRATMPNSGPLALLAPGGGANPGTQMPSKRWDPAGFASVAAALHAAGATVALVGAAGDRAVAAAVRATAPAVHDRTGQTSIAGLAALAATAGVMVANDSGVAHLAAAVGCPTVAIFGPTSAELYAPRGDWVRIIAPPGADRLRGDGSVRQPFVFHSRWQDAIPLAAVRDSALAGLRIDRGTRP
ncbi:MAG: glycosyltransferase family 9 protein [Chloroflexota bacterium]